MTTGQVDSVPLVIPLPARPKQLLTFSFADTFRIRRPGSDYGDPTPRVTVVGPQTQAQAGLSVYGRIDNFTIHFHPSGFNRLFGIPMTELTDAAYDAYAVIGPEIPRLEHELGATFGFAERIQIVERRLISMLRCIGTPDPVAIAANSLFANNGVHRVSAMATYSGLSPRQFERRFLAQVGVPPKLYARIVRFNAALDHKLQRPGRAWSSIANDHEFYDQMHLVHDCRAFTGESPSRFLAHLEGVPAFHSMLPLRSVRDNSRILSRRRLFTIFPHRLSPKILKTSPRPSPGGEVRVASECIRSARDRGLTSGSWPTAGNCEGGNAKRTQRELVFVSRREQDRTGGESR